MQLTSLESTKEAQTLLLNMVENKYQPGDIHKHTNNSVLSTHIENLINGRNVDILATVVEINKELTVTPIHSQPLEFDEVVMGKLALMLVLQMTMEPSATVDHTLNELYQLSYVHQKA